MHTSLLATTIRIPPQRHDLVRRARLSDALERGIPHSKLALITAPAGYGKTTLLCQWARMSRLRVAWLSLETDDNDLERFLRYLVSAWDEMQPGIAVQCERHATADRYRDVGHGGPWRRER